MKVRVIYDPVLRKATSPVAVFDMSLNSTAEKMMSTMRQHDGIGLAANQVGIDLSLIVMEYTPDGDEDTLPAIPRTILCNPKVVRKSSEVETAIEGCLSLPGLELPVERSTAAVVEGQNLSGKPVRIKAKGLFARVLQHEIDHINGILFTDHIDDIFQVKSYQFAKIIFFGSDDFSLPILRNLVESGYQVVAVVSETGKKSGRGQQITDSPTKQYADEQGITHFSVGSSSEIVELLKQVKPALLVLASYGKILPAEALTIPDFGCINIHPSTLPEYRGATPIQSVLLDGLDKTGVTIMQMLPEVDAGSVIAQESVGIELTDTFATLKSRLAIKGGELLTKVLPSYLAGQSRIVAQDEEQATYTKKISKSDGEIDWTEPLTNIERKIRAYHPWPGSYTRLGDKRLKVNSARIRDGKLELVDVQLEGKTPTNWADFRRGYEQQLTREAWYGKIYR